MDLILTSQTLDIAYHTAKYTELEKCIEMNTKLQEMKIEYRAKELPSTIVSVIRGVTGNKTIKSLTLHVNVFNDASPASPPLPDGVIEQLLKDNNTLQVLSLDIPDEILPSSLNIVEVNTPLTALEIGRRNSCKLRSLLPHIKGLHCLILHDSYPPHLLFLSHPSLHTLTLPLDTAESAIELFTILQTNTTLKALSVVTSKIEMICTSSVSTSLQDMLAQNQTLKYLEIINLWRKNVPSSFLSILKTGLERLKCNTSLQQLSVPIPLNKDVRNFINVISQMTNLTEMEMCFALDQSYSDVSFFDEKRKELTPLFYEQVLPAVTNMLESHTTMRLLRIECEGIIDNEPCKSCMKRNWIKQKPNWIKLIQHLYKTIFIHPSLEYIEFQCNSLLRTILEDQKKTLIDRHRKEQPHKPLPIVNILHSITEYIKT